MRTQHLNERTSRRATLGALLLLLVLLALPQGALAGTPLEGKAWLKWTTSAVLTSEAQSVASPEIHLPSDYHGTPAYSSKATKYATIDASTGVITYTGAGKGSSKGDYYGTVDFEVTLPANGNYDADTLTYTVYFGKQTYSISSTADWKTFYKKYNSNCIVRLNCNLEMARDDYAEEFNGYFDGQGNTITYQVKDKWAHYSHGYTLFNEIKKNSVIKNLRVITSGYTGSFWVAGLAYTVTDKATAIIENCSSEMSFETEKSGFSGARAAGFISTVDEYSTVHFKDCSSKGTNTIGKDFPFGGYVYYARGDKQTTVTFENCYSDITLANDNKNNKVANFVYAVRTIDGWGIRWDANISSKNCYARKQDLFTQDYEEKMGVILADNDELASGKIAYQLNAGRTRNDIAWVQYLGYDTNPQLKDYTDYQLEVFYTPAEDRNISSQWATLCYPTHVDLPDGVQAHVVKKWLHEWNGTKSIELSPLITTNNRNIPMVLHTDNPTGIGTIHLPGLYFNEDHYSTHGSVLQPSYTGNTTPAGAYLQQANGSFKKADEGTPLQDFSCYLMPTDQTQDELAIYNDTTNTFIISSKEDWCKADSLNTRNAQITLVLNTDLELNDSDLYITNDFTGILDGQGHTVTLNYSGGDDYASQHGMFNRLVGNVIIRNLNIVGTINCSDRAWFTTPLARSCVSAIGSLPGQESLADSTVIENVHVGVTFNCSDKSLNSTGAGFISTVDGTHTNLIFRDCSFTGKLVGPTSAPNFGCFIGNQNATISPKVSFINCLSDPSGSTPTDAMLTNAGFDYFVGGNGSTTAKNNTVTNSYCRFIGEVYSDGFVYNYYSNRCNVPTVSGEQLKSGETAFKLNAGRTADNVRWAETIGEDTIPQPKTFAPQSKEVLYAAESTRAATADQWATLFYPADVTLPADGNVDVYNDFAWVADTIYIYGAVTDTVAANQPALLYSANGMPELTLPERYYNKQDFDAAGDVLCGSYGNVSGDNICQLTMTNGEPTFTRSDATVPAWTAYVQSDAYDVIYIHDDGVIIASQDEWNTFKTKYNGRKVNVRLFTPLTIASADDAMQKYSGTFNAYGAAISTTGGNLFAEAEGTILNIQHDGSHPLVGQTSGNLTFKNCKTSGMPLLASTGHAVTFDHCFSNMSAQTSSSTDAFVAIINGGSATATTSYVWGTNCTNNANATVATDEQVKGGELTYLLNDNLTDDCLWTQTLGTDTDPQLWSYDSETVYQASGTLATNASGYGTCYYPAYIELPEGIKAYTATEVKDTLEKSGVLVLTELTSAIPAYTPVVLYSENGQATTSALPAAYYNLTPVSQKIAELSGPLYALPYDSENTDLTEYGWYLLKDDAFAPADSTSSYQAWTCYISPNEASKAYDKIYIPNPTATAISTLISTASGNGKTYDLQGRQVRTLRKGEVYIKNGVKFTAK